MPIPYKTTRYGCQFKCGTRRRNTEKKAEMHEAICWHNPENKTCKTCKHELYFQEFLEDRSIMVRGCDNELGDNLIINNYNELANEDKSQIKPIINCPYHEFKTV